MPKVRFTEFQFIAVIKTVESERNAKDAFRDVLSLKAATAYVLPPLCKY